MVLGGTEHILEKSRPSIGVGDPVFLSVLPDTLEYE
jgi:hypothetical protein